MGDLKPGDIVESLLGNVWVDCLKKGTKYKFLKYDNSISELCYLEPTEEKMVQQAFKEFDRGYVKLRREDVGKVYEKVNLFQQLLGDLK